MTPSPRPRPWSAVAVLLVVGLLSAACGGSSASGGATVAPSGVGEGCPATPAPVQDALADWDPAGQDPTVFPSIINPAGTIACGPTRFMFSFLDAQNVPVAAPDRPTSVAFYDLGSDPATPVIEADATFIWAIEDEVGVYIANIELPTSGLWGVEFRTTPPGGAEETIRVQFDVQPTSSVVAVGDPAPASETPTLADVDGDVSRISTDDQPVERFYETSIAGAVAAGEPFVVVFATPKFCATAQCGPTLEQVKPIAAAHPELTFINVEPYELHDVDGQLQPVLTGDPAQLTPVPAATEWRLAAEPWIFVVDGEGIIRSSLMLNFAPEELEAAIAAVS